MASRFRSQSASYKRGYANGYRAATRQVAALLRKMKG